MKNGQKNGYVYLFMTEIDRCSLIIAVMLYVEMVISNNPDKKPRSAVDLYCVM